MHDMGLTLEHDSSVTNKISIIENDHVIGSTTYVPTHVMFQIKPTRNLAKVVKRVQKYTMDLYKVEGILSCS